MKTARRTAVWVACAVLITALVSVALTLAVAGGGAGRVLSREEYQAYRRLLPLLELNNTIQAEHYGREVSEQRLLRGALSGMLAALDDPYARYYTEEEYLLYLEQLGGAYHGIGALIGQPEGQGAPVLKVYEKSPAQKAGLLEGDIITAVDGSVLSGLTLEEIEMLFYGEDGTRVTLTLQRGEKTMSMTATRGEGMTQRVEHRLLKERTGYIRLDKFTGAAAEEFCAALQDLTNRGMRSLVVDRRDNPGGELTQVVAVADALLPAGVIVSVRRADGGEEVYRSGAEAAGVPLAVLINGNSASASEILAAAVQDSGTGVVVGSRTYGKGVVQTTMQLESNGGWVKLTTAAYYTPKGVNVDGVGVEPDIGVALAGKYKDMPIARVEEDDDAQLAAALNEVRSEAGRKRASQQ